MTTLHRIGGGVFEQFSIPQPRDEMCPSSRVDTSAVTNVAVTPAAKPFDVLAGLEICGSYHVFSFATRILMW